MLEVTPKNTAAPPRIAAYCRVAANFLTAHGALPVCALFLLVGVVILDDYGVAWDEGTQRNIAIMNLDYILGNSDALLEHRDRVYGVAFELPLLLAERALGLEDIRDIHLLRHILTHLFFIAGGFFGYRLAYRLFDNRLIALFALLLYLLHPRLYAHSFFNSKDLAFFSMFIIALYLVERAFRRDTVGAFILGGIGVGLLTDIRIMGIMLFPAALAMRGIDLCFAAGWAERRRIMLTGGGFVLATGIALYAVWPYLWSDPGGRFIETWLRFSDYPNEIQQLFRGQWIDDEVPPDYVPVWFAITTPPLALLLGLVGAAALAWSGITRPMGIFRNGATRFGLLLLACFTLPVAAVILLDSNLYTGWRQLFFIYAPGGLLAVWGLSWLLRSLRSGYWRAGVVGLAGAGAGLTVLQMMQLHPYQQVYFNFLVDRETPEYLGTQYDLDYWGLSPLEGLRYLAAAYPEGQIIIGVRQDNGRELLPAGDRERVRPLVFDDAEFYIEFQRRLAFDGGLSPIPEEVLYSRRIYNNTVLVVARNAEMKRQWEEEYQAVKTWELLADSEFDLYRKGNGLTYVREPCERSDRDARFDMEVVPRAAEDLPRRHQERGHDNRGFSFYGHGKRFNGKCVVSTLLPDYPVARFRTGQKDWKVEVDLRVPEYRAEYAAVTAGAPSFRSEFNLYRRDKGLIYAKGPCTAEDVAARFYLHIWPARESDLPAGRREFGFDNRDFPFEQYGARFDGKCLAVAPWPDYRIKEVRTGQFIPGQGQLWQGKLAVGQ